jgi:glycosyl transferase family 7 (putative galactosyltransferase)
VNPFCSFSFLTTREDPKIEWFMDSLARELDSLGPSKPTFELIIIDSRLWYVDQDERRQKFRDAAKGRFGELIHVPPKPSVWQGPARLTTFDMFCGAGARNTAFCYARGEHVVFVDDLSVLLPGWASGHLHAAQFKYVMCGSTCKNLDMVVEDGIVKSFTLFPPGQDHRLRGAPKDGSVRCSGSWLFGGTFSVPLNAALDVNGFDEINNGIGCEDYDFGIRLDKSGQKICFNKTCGTMESEEAHHLEPHTLMLRIDKKLNPAIANTIPGDGHSSNLLYDRLINAKSPWTTDQHQPNLRQLRDRILSGGQFPIPTEPRRHWVDGQPLELIKPTFDGFDDEERGKARRW